MGMGAKKKNLSISSSFLLRLSFVANFYIIFRWLLLIWNNPLFLRSITLEFNPQFDQVLPKFECIVWEFKPWFNRA